MGYKYSYILRRTLYSTISRYDIQDMKIVYEYIPGYLIEYGTMIL